MKLTLTFKLYLKDSETNQPIELGLPNLNDLVISDYQCRIRKCKVLDIRFSGNLGDSFLVNRRILKSRIAHLLQRSR